MKDLEQGCVYFDQMGWFNVEFLYKKHTIRLTMASEYNKDNDYNNDIHIMYGGKDITERYLEGLHDTLPKIKTTLKNIVMVTDIIDQNLDAFEQMKNEEVSA